MAEQGTSVDWHGIDPASALERLDSTDHGLSQAEAQTRLQQHGANALPPAPPEPAWRRFARQFQNTLIYVLLVSGVISLLMGHRVDAGVIFGVVLINAEWDAAFSAATSGTAWARITPNSSPPRRPTMSDSRTFSASNSAIWRKAASPAAWPCWSLISLKPLMSK